MAHGFGIVVLQNRTDVEANVVGFWGIPIASTISLVSKTEKLTLPDWTISSSSRPEAAPPAKNFICIAEATTRKGMMARTTRVNFQLLIKAYTRQATIVVMDIAI